MNTWLTGARGHVLLALLWGVAWAPAAVLIGLIVDADGSMDEMWPAIGAYPGFIAGALFSLILFQAARDRGFAQLSLTRFAALGGVAGLLFGMFPYAVATSSPDITPTVAGIVSIGLMTTAGTISAAMSLMLGRISDRPSRKLGAD